MKCHVDVCSSRTELSLAEQVEITTTCERLQLSFFDITKSFSDADLQCMAIGGEL